MRALTLASVNLRAADTPDEDLMLLYAGGDAAAFERLYARHRGGLYRYLTRQCSDRGAAEELFQDVWASVVQARVRYRPDARFATWLYALAHNRLVDWYRHHGKVRWQSLDESDDEDAGGGWDAPAARTAQPEVVAESKQMAHKLLDLLAQLPPAQRDAFLLHEEGGLSVEDIAFATGVAAETAKSRLRYALAKLRQGLADLR